MLLILVEGVAAYRFHSIPVAMNQKLIRERLKVFEFRVSVRGFGCIEQIA